MKNLIAFLFFTICFHSLIASSNNLEENAFSKGYFISKLEDRFPNEQIELDVQNYTIIIYGFPDNEEVCKNIHLYLEGFLNYVVVFDRLYVPNQEICFESDVAPLEILGEEGNLLPELNPFFPTMLAKPHIIGYSAGYRSYDKIFKTSLLPVSIGDQFSLYQFKTDTYGRFYLGIEACVWAIFEARAKSLSLINADYYVALPITYITDKFAARLRIFHESTHLGDEFLLENKGVKRLNPSSEAVDLSLAYDLTDQLTIFLGYTRVLRSDDSYKIKPNSVYYGFNFYFNFWKIKFCNLEANPYIATSFLNSQDNKWRFDKSIAIGYEWNKLYGRKFRIYVEGYDGCSADGQFSKQYTNYVALKMFYGY